MKKILLTLILISGTTLTFADATGIYIGGGIGYGNQELHLDGASTTFGTPAIRVISGYQFANWLGVELGYNYISQSTNWNNVGTPSTTIYDLSFTPGFSLPGLPLTIFGRAGIDGISANLNSSWYNQVISNVQSNFVWGGGLKIDIPFTRTFVRAEYMNFGSAINNNNSNLTVQPSAYMITAGYVF